MNHNDKEKQWQEFLENNFAKEWAYYRKFEEEQAEYDDFPEDLNPSIRAALQGLGIEKLYKHQKQCYESVRSGFNTTIVTRTASGKTLSFFLPILNQYLQQPFTTLLIYPTKALARDQEGSLFRLIHLLQNKENREKSGLAIGTFDGDTPREERDRLIRGVDFVATNPDMLHNGILPNHMRKWKGFLSRLKYIVIDEVHTFRGAYGSHFCQILKRLLRICSFHGSSPQMICSSATIANPKEFVENLCSKSFQIIDEDSSFKSLRHLYFFNPQVKMDEFKGTVYRQSPKSIIVKLLQEATRLELRTICFARARQEVERIYTSTREILKTNKDKIKPYRGGLLPLERRQLEKDLTQGSLNTVISTNALELGIDIGGLQVCIISGHPGSLASFWQQAGRVGRGKKQSYIIFVAKDTAIDQYMINNPDYITGTPLESALVSPNNPYIMLSHLACAAYEIPLAKKEEWYDSLVYETSVEALVDDKTLSEFEDSYCYELEEYPSKGVNIRGLTDYNIQISDRGLIIGEIDPIGARGTLFKDAIYQHIGKKYMSLDLDLDKKLCQVEPVHVDYFTEAVWQNTIKHSEIFEEITEKESLYQFGSIMVTKQPKIYKKIRERSYENIGYGPITLKPFIYETTGFSIKPSQKWLKIISDLDKRLIHAAFLGVSYLLKAVSHIYFLGDPKDTATDVSLQYDEKDSRWDASIYFYDTVEGGVGFAEKVFEQRPKVLKHCYEIVSQCSCTYGCPGCVPSLPAPLMDEETEVFLKSSSAAKEAARSLLLYLLNKEYYQPQTKVHMAKQFWQQKPLEIDQERLKLKKKASVASRMLKRKRERIHC